MTFRLNDSQIEELLQIEEEVNCDIGAGADNGPHLGEFLADAVNYINDRKLMALLQDELSSVLSSDEIEAIANVVQAQVRHYIQRKSA